jgi:tetratricopeptide (TPR) repeat protein
MPQDADEDQYRRGFALQQAGRHVEAVAVYRDLAARVLTLKLATNLGVSLGEIGERGEALHYLTLAARHLPGDQTIGRLLATAQAEAGDIVSAEAGYRAVLDAHPDDGEAQLALAGLYLSLGRYAEGWPLLAARTTLHAAVVPPVDPGFPEWRGQPLAGKAVLVWIEQGFGDQIQMARFANALKARGAARVTLGCRPALAHLFSTLSGVDAVIPIATKGVVDVGLHDYWSRYFSLPEHLGVTLKYLPAEPYLAAPADSLERWRNFGGGARVGLVWQASPTGFNAANKGLPPDQARWLLDAGAVSLQPEDTGAADFADTAAIVDGLDLVISIDTAVAHLAGAMGKPCWTLLPYVHSDWRWLRGRGDSPWYPQMRLYRHGDRQNWPGVVDMVLADLAAAGLGSP